MKVLMKRALFVLVLMGCGGEDPVDPADQPLPFRVAFSQVVISKGFNAATGMEECRFTITAAASGGVPGEFALWTSYDVSFRFPDGTRGDFVLGLPETVDFWKSDRILTGSSVSATPTGQHPSKTFTLVYTFRYTLPSGERRSQTISTCL